jgi:hypothetical protein
MSGMITDAPRRSSFKIRWVMGRLSGLFSREMCRKKTMTAIAMAPIGRLEKISGRRVEKEG